MNTRCYLFGGSFDPPHLGHQVLIQGLRSLAARSVVDHIRIMPAAQSPFKTHRDHAPSHHRLAMLELMLEDIEEQTGTARAVGASFAEASEALPLGSHSMSRDNNALRTVPVMIDTYELNEGGVSYTVRTIRHLQELGLDPILVIGADNLYGLEDWKEHAYLLENVALVVFRREGQSLESMEYGRSELQKRYSVRSIELLDICPPGCASSEIRHAFGRAGQPQGSKSLPEDGLISSCLSRSIFHYIRQNDLYRGQGIPDPG